MLGPRASTTLARIGLIVCGTYYTVVGMLLFAAPRLFYEHIGRIGAFNEHYSRDVGSFTLPLGLALFWLARRPFKYRLFAWYAVVASAFHAASHFMDGINTQRAANAFIFFIGVTALLCLPLLKEQETLR